MTARSDVITLSTVKGAGLSAPDFTEANRLREKAFSQGEKVLNTILENQQRQFDPIKEQANLQFENRVESLKQRIAQEAAVAAQTAPDGTDPIQTALTGSQDEIDLLQQQAIGLNILDNKAASKSILGLEDAVQSEFAATQERYETQRKTYQAAKERRQQPAIQQIEDLVGTLRDPDLKHDDAAFDKVRKQLHKLRKSSFVHPVTGKTINEDINIEKYDQLISQLQVDARNNEIKLTELNKARAKDTINQKIIEAGKNAEIYVPGGYLNRAKKAEDEFNIKINTVLGDNEFTKALINADNITTLENSLVQQENRLTTYAEQSLNTGISDTVRDSTLRQYEAQLDATKQKLSIVRQRERYKNRGLEAIDQIADRERLYFQLAANDSAVVANVDRNEIANRLDNIFKSKNINLTKARALSGLLGTDPGQFLDRNGLIKEEHLTNYAVVQGLNVSLEEVKEFSEAHEKATGKNLLRNKLVGERKARYQAILEQNIKYGDPGEAAKAFKAVFGEEAKTWLFGAFDERTNSYAGGEYNRALVRYQYAIDEGILEPRQLFSIAVSSQVEDDEKFSPELFNMRINQYIEAAEKHQKAVAAAARKGLIEQQHNLRVAAGVTPFQRQNPSFSTFALPDIVPQSRNE